MTPKVDLLSSDGWTRKILFTLPDRAQIETVLMEYDTRNTVCVSTQAGCAMGCTFCATGQGGFQRNLTAGEIVEQVLFFDRELRKTDLNRIVAIDQSPIDQPRAHGHGRTLCQLPSHCIDALAPAE